MGPGEELYVDTAPAETYRGFDLYPLLYRAPIPDVWPRPKMDRMYGVSVLICREGVAPGGPRSQVFRLQIEPIESIGSARRAAIAFAQRIIDGSVDGQTVASL
ncbi:hypothetical protein CJO78_03760 [Ralstonia solanacearum]|nr:hypothetical protein LBM2029_03595 [Ralstonia solanacearum]AXV76114.1 hypothetical protein CJO76_03480 [Ralstonia solanacearum]AXV85479.1 hypothetical protein CJO78_03760 [Ralstonia solanacearum]AXV90118.1 hypothetical protein CJO79_03480 [Ralstonia solanacearum]AXW04991.1 hypothetical protein CJO82_03535 [Ralstonia solanacearum]